ncbi:hypothetical protein WJX77_012440 [Trebouxia sp. C0004]
MVSPSLCSLLNPKQIPKSRKVCPSALRGRRDIPRHNRQQQLSAAAWAGEFQTAASSSSDLEDQSEGNSKFKQLCHSQLKLISTVIQRPQGAYNTRITLYRREAATLDAGQLQLSKITTFTDPGVQTSPPDLDGTLFLGLAGTGASSRGAEKALTEAQLVDLPNTGAFVLPLAAHSFLVGLLVIEQLALLPHLPADDNAVALQQLRSRRSAETALGSSVEDVMLSGKDREVVQLAGQVLSSACAMDLHSALDRAQSAMRSQQVLGLVEEVRGPLTALRTLGSILVPRLRQKEGQEIDRDVAQGILTQGDRLQEVVCQLQAAIHPVALPSTFGPVSKGGLPAAAKTSKQFTTVASRTLLPPMKQDSSADDQLQA